MTLRVTGGVMDVKILKDEGEEGRREGLKVLTRESEEERQGGV